MARIAIYATYDGPETDLPDDATLEEALRARLSEVYIPDGPVTINVLGVDVEDDL